MIEKALIAAAASLCVACTPAHAVTFGADLNRPANSTATCSDFLFFQTPPSCSATSVNLATGESGYPPAGEGIVTAMRVKVGPQTAPMQFVVEEALRQDNPGDPGHPTYACCKAVDVSQVFTPAPNAVTTVPVNFRVKQSLSPEPSGYYVDDHLSLSVLANNVPIPASLDQNSADSLWFPAWQRGEERAGAYGTSGATILIGGEWQPLDAGQAAIALTSNAARVANGRALVNLVCNLTGAACDGRLLLQSQQARVGLRPIRPASKSATYAKAKFSIPAGKSKQVRAKLKRAGKRLLDKHKSAKVWLNVKMDDGTPVPSTRLKLKR